MSGAAVGASIDVGSNTVHLLVAAIDGHRLDPLVDQSVFLGLGGAVDQYGLLGSAGRSGLVQALEGYVATSRQLGASHITLLGAEPIRRAGDAARICDEVGAATGVPLHVLTHEEEGLLTLVGVTGGAPVREATLVLDIGGGSSEFAAVRPGRAPRAWGLRMGSNRLALRAASQDPPTLADIDRMRAFARPALREALDDAPERVVAVGGTATNVLKVTTGGPADRRVDRARLAEALAVLAGDPADVIAQRYTLKPTRARLLGAGVVLLEAVLDRYGVEALTVVDAGMREGAILVAHHAGRAWRDRLPALAHGWRPG